MITTDFTDFTDLHGILLLSIRVLRAIRGSLVSVLGTLLTANRQQFDHPLQVKLLGIKLVQR